MAAAPKKIDLAALSLSELRELVTEATALIAVKEREAKEALRVKIMGLAESEGFSIGDLFGGTPHAPAEKQAPAKRKAASGERGTVAMKYRNPADPSQAWSGRGRKPVWVQAHLDGGGTLEDLLIR